MKAIGSDRRKYKKFCDKLKEIQNLKKILNRRILLKIEKKKVLLIYIFLKC